MSDPGDGAVEVEGYRLVPVYGRVGAELRRGIERMWVDEGALTLEAAVRRVDEVVVAILAPAGEVAGVNTAYVQRLAGGSDAWYFYRTFVRAAYRGRPAVASAAFVMAVDVLRAAPHPMRPAGLLAVVENPKLANAGPMKRMGRLGLHLIGRDKKRGRDVWGARFDGAIPVLPPGLLDAS
jgi:hypothetical protein